MPTRQTAWPNWCVQTPFALSDEILRQSAAAQGNSLATQSRLDENHVIIIGNATLLRLSGDVEGRQKGFPGNPVAVELAQVQQGFAQQISG